MSGKLALHIAFSRMPSRAVQILGKPICQAFPENLDKMLETNPDLDLTTTPNMLASIAMSPNIFGLVTKTFFQSTLADEFFSSREFLTDSYMLDAYGSRDYTWRLSNEAFGNTFYVLVMRKFEPWRNNVSEIILRIAEGQLLLVAEPINLISVNRNPHA